MLTKGGFFFARSTVKGGSNNWTVVECPGLWVEFKCPLCGKDLDDDKAMANFLVCGDSSHGLLRFFTGDGCYFTTNEVVAEELMKKERGFTLSILRNSLGIRQLISNSYLVIRQES